MTNIKHGDLITLDNGDLVEVILKVVKKKEIIPIAGNRYKLEYTGAFCHWYGSPSFDTGREELSDYTFQYIGNVEASAGVRAIFFCKEITSYVMFSINNFDYIVEQL
jgi:hypothetical protein